jgi:hypothetical protein
MDVIVVAQQGPQASCLDSLLAANLLEEMSTLMSWVVGTPS